MTETTKTPNPLKQARREKREAKAIKRFIKDYREINRGGMTTSERAMIRDMIGLASIQVQVASDALDLLQATEVTK